MTNVSLIEKAGLELETLGDEAEITGVYCCDLLSLAMGRAPQGSVWVTVMGNVNTVAVASLADVACVVLAEGMAYDERAIEAAREQGVTLLKSPLPVYETAVGIGKLL